MEIIEITEGTEKPTTITVKDIRKAIENLPDDLEVLFNFPYDFEMKEYQNEKIDFPDGFGIKEVKYEKDTAISSKHLSITPSGPLWW